MEYTVLTQLVLNPLPPMQDAALYSHGYRHQVAVMASNEAWIVRCGWCDPESCCEKQDVVGRIP